MVKWNAEHLLHRESRSRTRSIVRIRVSTGLQVYLGKPTHNLPHDRTSEPAHLCRGTKHLTVSLCNVGMVVLRAVVIHYSLPTGRAFHRPYLTIVTLT